MGIVSIIGPKGGIGKTTLSINTAAALTHAIEKQNPDKRVCLFDLDLRLPTITSILDSHPQRTFYDLFETLANKTYQVDYIRTLYRILTIFKRFLDGEIEKDNQQLERSLALYKNLDTELFNFADFKFGNEIHELFLYRSTIQNVSQLKNLVPLLDGINLTEFKEILKECEHNSRPVVQEYINYIEEYGLSILGGEVPILGKRSHRKRINEPAFLLLFLDFLHEVFDKFQYVVLDTPAGGVNHLSSLMNSIDQALFVFDMSNIIAINGSIDALHSFIDYYEDFYQDFTQGKLTGLDKAYVNRLVASRGEEAVRETLENKRLGILLNRCQDTKGIDDCLNRLREYLDTLDKLESYKNRINIVGMVPHHKIINITNNHGALFYDKDRALSIRMDLIARSIISEGKNCPTLAHNNQHIISYLQSQGKPGLLKSLSRVASSLS